MKTIVDKEDERPAGKKGECFYCQRKIGEEHTWECVIPEKRVRVKTTFTYETNVPRSWDAHDIEFHRNESSSCQDNILDELEEYKKVVGCMCNCGETEFIEDVVEKETN